MTGVKAPLARKGLSAALAAVFLVAFLAEALAGNHAYRLFVDGLACPFCAYGVEKKIGGLDGVEKVEIEIEDGLVAVTLTAGATLDEATAKQAIDEAGFTLRRFEAPKK
ncbi:MAG: heavy-metal-associated domain-containing protein [Proteobacteria bacterium]|nr:heavy-metal-associated domain-containing protein [Pseudomonadota bacterium]